MSQIHELLDVSDDIYNRLIDIIPPVLAQSFLEPTPVRIKGATIVKVINLIGSCSDEPAPNTYALIGLMVEQAYNAAVLQSTRKPLFKKR